MPGIVVIRHLGQNELSVSDTFTRANDALLLGNAETRQTWNPGSIGDAPLPTWGISSNKAYCPAINASSAPHAWVESRLANCTIQCYLTVDTAAGGQAAGLLVRRQDNQNYWDIRASNVDNTVVVRRVSAGVLSVRATYAVALVDGQVIALRVVCRGSLIQTYVDNVLLGTVTDATAQTGTKHGLAVSGGAAARWDNFSVIRRGKHLL